MFASMGGLGREPPQTARDMRRLGTFLAILMLTLRETCRLMRMRDATTARNVLGRYVNGTAIFHVDTRFLRSARIDVDNDGHDDITEMHNMSRSNFLGTCIHTRYHHRFS